jgi:O-antigen/teichoic acid export membrane protein
VTWLGASAHGWILAALLGPASFGVYRAAYQVVNVLNPLRQAASNHLPSSASRCFATGGLVALREWQRATAWRLTLPFVACATALVLCAEPISRLMYGRTLEISNLRMFVALGALSYAINFARAPFDYALLAAGGARWLFIRTLALSAFVLTGGALLIWSLGIYGALVSELLTAILAALLTVYALWSWVPRPIATDLVPAAEGSRP